MPRVEKQVAAEAAKWIADLSRAPGGQLRLRKESGVSQSVMSRVACGRELPSMQTIANVYRVHGDTAPASVRELMKRHKHFVDSLPLSSSVAATTAAAPRSLDDAMMRVRGILSASVDESRRKVRKVVEAAQAYGDAVESEQVDRLLSALGADAPACSSRHDAALALYDAILAVPELASLLAPVSAPKPPPRPRVAVATSPAPAPLAAAPVPTEDERPAPEPVAESAGVEPAIESRWPYLARVSAKSPLMIVGGVAVPERLGWLRERGVRADWVEFGSARGDRQIDAAVKRLRGTGACGVVVLYGLLGHVEGSKITGAARYGMVPTVSIRMPGSAELERAVDEIEKKLATLAKGAGAK